MIDTMTLKDFFERFLALPEEDADKVIRDIRSMVDVEPDPDFGKMENGEIAQLCLLEVEEAFLDTQEMELQEAEKYWKQKLYGAG